MSLGSRYIYPYSRWCMFPSVDVSRESDDAEDADPCSSACMRSEAPELDYTATVNYVHIDGAVYSVMWLLPHLLRVRVRRAVHSTDTARESGVSPYANNTGLDRNRHLSLESKMSYPSYIFGNSLTSTRLALPIPLAPTDHPESSTSGNHPLSHSHSHRAEASTASIYALSHSGENPIRFLRSTPTPSTLHSLSTRAGAKLVGSSHGSTPWFDAVVRRQGYRCQAALQVRSQGSGMTRHQNTCIGL